MCDLLSLLTNVTRPPTGIVTYRGEAPADVIVIVAADGLGLGVGVGAGVGLGELGESPPPHDAATVATSIAVHRETMIFFIRKTSLKC